MKNTIVEKILRKNLIEGKLEYGSEIVVKVNQTLTQDSTGTMAYLQLERLNVNNVKTDVSVAYIDHNMLQSSFENADDHEFIKTCALKHGVIYSKAGNGICHRVHLENFAKPGGILIGSDSHTPTAGGIGMLAIGAGGLDVAIGMATGTYRFNVPKIYNIRLENDLRDWVSAKDIILEILQKLSVKGGINYIFEYTGSGLKNLSVEDRATITNMGAELGATSSIFEADEQTYDFLKIVKREKDYMELKAEENAEYDEQLIIDLSMIKPKIAFPHSPDNVKDIPSEKIYLDQVCIGSCTNSSYKDLMILADVLDGKQVHQDISLTVSVGSANLMAILSSNGALQKMINAGARILETSCGPCIGMGQAPKTNGKSLRTFNRNFKGRSGTKESDVYLSSVETAAVSAINGYISSYFAKDIKYNIYRLSDDFKLSNSLFIYPNLDTKIEVIKGPNIKDIPIGNSLKLPLEKKAVIKLKDAITTDDICPSNASLLPYRSNIPYLSNFAFTTIVSDFAKRCEKHNGGIIVAGENYGQGSSREHAAMLPLYLGIKAVLAKSFARIHKANLINNGILPLKFKNKDDYDFIEQNDCLVIDNISDVNNIILINKTKDIEICIELEVNKRQCKILQAGGLLNSLRME